MENKNEVFGKRLKLLRDKTGKSQEDIAKAIGISRARYSHYENNHVEPDMSLIRQLSELYNVSTDYLLGITEIPHRDEESKRDEIIHKIATEYPDIDLMFKDMENMTADDFQDIYDYIKFKMSQKEKED